VPEPTGSEVGVASENRKRYKPPVTGHVAAELIAAEGRRLYSETHRLIYSIRKKGELPRQWKQTVTVPVYENNCNTFYSIYRGTPMFRINTHFIQNCINCKYGQNYGRSFIAIAFQPCSRKFYRGTPMFRINTHFIQNCINCIYGQNYGGCFIATAFQPCSRLCHYEGPAGFETWCDTSASDLL
jgi:hypothetical protein